MWCCVNNSTYVDIRSISTADRPFDSNSDIVAISWVHHSYGAASVHLHHAQFLPVLLVSNSPQVLLATINCAALAATPLEIMDMLGYYDVPASQTFDLVLNDSDCHTNCRDIVCPGFPLSFSCPNPIAPAHSFLSASSFQGP